MNIEIRLETPADYRETETVVREAFWNHFAPGCDEHYLLYRMRDCADFVRELDFVAVCDGRIVGSSVCAKGEIRGDDGETYEVLSLGPIAVYPDCQRLGIGAKLLAETARVAKELGCRAILLCGDPDYYSRLGFRPAQEFGIRMAEDEYFDALQARELYDGALKGLQGRYVESEIYAVDGAAAAEYDEKFPHKQKITGTPSQIKFLETIQKHRPAFE